jgi:ABC-2 type transport system permease protein
MTATKLSEFRGTRELLSNLVLRELRGRYKRSILGWAWSLINPLATVLIYWLVFSVFLKVEPPRGDPSGLKSFVLFLLCGLLPYRFLAESISGATDSLLMNANLVKKVYFPRELVVLSTIGSLLVTFLIELGVLLVMLLIFGNMVLPWIPLVLVIVALETVLLVGITLILAPLNVYFRDVKHFVGIALQLLFYATPIVYPLSLVPKHPHVLGLKIPFRTLYELNPLVVLVECFRDAMYDLKFPSLGDIGYLVAVSFGILLIGRWIFGRLDHRLAVEV